MTENLSPPAPSGFALETRDVSFAYAKAGKVLDGCTVSIKAGGVFAVLGPNGCGKTTLLKIFLGLLKPSAGWMKINGEITFVPQLFQVTFSYSVLDMVLMGRAKKIGLFSRPAAPDIEAAQSALACLGVADLAARPFQELSGGQRQLVMLARALTAEAEILILDEPASALDLKNQFLLLTWIKRLSRERGLTIVFSTHLPQHALTAADEALLMSSGGRHSAGPIREVMSEEKLFELYGVPLKFINFDYQGRPVESLVPVFAGT
ncbi:MAG: ABC transporter ATP-binding protein [Candidatus Adiutrix sp.]|jgi:iron complex transport system ATP-binding protein|nr:ABC transporter ATP-binding protein [Candidatus Adiutrix sp.]